MWVRTPSLHVRQVRRSRRRSRPPILWRGGHPSGRREAKSSWHRQTTTARTAGARPPRRPTFKVSVPSTRIPRLAPGPRGVQTCRPVEWAWGAQGRPCPPVGPPTPQEDTLAASASEASSPHGALDSVSGPQETASLGSQFSPVSDLSEDPAPCNLEEALLRTGPRQLLWVPQLEGLSPMSWDAMVPMTRAQFEEL